MSIGAYQDAKPARAGGVRGFVQMLGISFVGHTSLTGILAVYFACAVAVSLSFDGLASQDFGALSLTFFTAMVPLLAVAIVAFRFLHLVMHERPKHPTIALLRDLRDFTLHPSRLANALPVIIIMFWFVKVFSYFKANIPVLMPFSWDIDFMVLDRWMHFGTDPWVWLQPLFGYAPVTFLVNVSYNVWFMAMWMMWVAFAFQRRQGELRTRFFVCFMLLWSVGGTLLAIIFSSAGPAYFARLGLTPDPYVPLMAYLNGVNQWLPLWAIGAQDILWAGYLGKQDVIVGISAMPSMHNASALLFALAGWKLDRRLGIVMAVYAVLIFLGSVHLAWHYAIDAYLGWALTLVVWWASKHIAAWDARMPWAAAQRRLNAAAETA